MIGTVRPPGFMAIHKQLGSNYEKQKNQHFKKNDAFHDASKEKDGGDSDAMVASNCLAFEDFHGNTVSLASSCS